MNYVLKTTSLTKVYSGKAVVDAVNMNIKKGDIYGFIGKNGAGKTTLIRMAVGLAKPLAGSIELFGSNKLDEGRSKIGTVIEYPAVYPNFTAMQNLITQQKLVGKNDYEEIAKILDVVGLSDTGKKKARNFSLGMKQRLAIAMALIGNPEFLILDEPINGLDPTGIKDIRNLILKLNREYGKTILISSHFLGELSKIATCYGIISDGILVDEFSADELKERVKKALVINVDNIELSTKLIGEHLKTENYKVVENNIYLYDDVQNPGEINQMLVKNGVMVNSLSISGEDYESYFISLMGGYKK